jgi:hypothetical protein
MSNPTRIMYKNQERVQSVAPEKIQEQIRQRAYEMYEQRGREDGHDLDDWLQAESEVTGKAKAVAA